MTDEYGQAYTVDAFVQMVIDWNAQSRNTLCRLAYADTGDRRIDPEVEYHDGEGNDFYNGEFC